MAERGFIKVGGVKRGATLLALVAIGIIVFAVRTGTNVCSRQETALPLRRSTARSPALQKPLVVKSTEYFLC